MELKDVVAGNKLIDVFMGNIIRKDGKTALIKPEPLTGHCIVDSKYHISWDWLMPVVEKINTIAIDNYGEMGVYIKPFVCYVCNEEKDPLIMCTIANHSTMIEMVWITCITFIHWFNSTILNPLKK